MKYQITNLAMAAIIAIMVYIVTLTWIVVIATIGVTVDPITTQQGLAALLLFNVVSFITVIVAALEA